MILDHLNFNHLQALDALLDEKGVTRAAERLGVTQSAMSHTLRLLREAFDDQLLVRSGRGGMTLTPRAEEIKKPLRLALKEVELAVSRAPGFDPATVKHRFKVAAPDFMCALLMPVLAATASQEAPNISFDLRPLSGLDQAEGLETGDLDMILGPVAPDLPGLKTRTLYKDHYVGVARKDHPMMADKWDRRTYQDLQHISVSAEGAAEDRLNSALGKLKVKRDFVIRLPYLLAAPMIVAFCDGVLTAPRTLAENYALVYPLKVVELDFKLPPFEQVSVWHERFDDDPAHKWLREIIVRALRAIGLGRAPTREDWA